MKKEKKNEFDLFFTNYAKLGKTLNEKLDQSTINNWHLRWKIY